MYIYIYIYIYIYKKKDSDTTESYECRKITTKRKKTKMLKKKKL